MTLAQTIELENHVLTTLLDRFDKGDNEAGLIILEFTIMKSEAVDKWKAANQTKKPTDK